MAARTLNLRSYYSNFKSMRGVVAVIGMTVPLVPKLKPGTWTEYLLAPLGGIDVIARVLLAVLCVAVTYLVYFVFQEQSHRARKRTFLISLLVLPFSCLILYMVASLLFVRKVDIPTLERSEYVSVGFQRSDFAKQTFGSMTDEEMLRSRGLDEEEIRKLWTQSSIVTARLALFVSWAGFALALVFGLSLGVLDHTEKAMNASLTRTT